MNKVITIIQNICLGLLYLLAFIGFMCMLNIISPIAPSLNDSPKLVMPSVAKVLVTSDGLGGEGEIVDSGSAVSIGSVTDNEGMSYSILLTCNHVVGDSKYVDIYQNGQVVDRKAKVLYADKKDDLAILESEYYMPPAKLFFGNVEPGDKELVVGAMLGKNIMPTPGFFAGIVPYMGLLEGSAPALMGDSGGATYDFVNGKWQLVGITEAVGIFPIEAGHKPNEQPKNASQVLAVVPTSALTYSIPMDVIRSFLKESKVSFKYEFNK